MPVVAPGFTIKSWNAPAVPVAPLTKNSNLTQEISKYTYNGLSESDYLKIVIHSIDFNQDLRKLDKIRNTNLLEHFPEFEQYIGDIDDN